MHLETYTAYYYHLMGGGVLIHSFILVSATLILPKGLPACNQPYTGSRLLSKPVSANHSASSKHKSLLLDLIN